MECFKQTNFTKLYHYVQNQMRDMATCLDIFITTNLEFFVIIGSKNQVADKICFSTIVIVISMGQLSF